MQKRKYDVIIYGATGFTGGLVAEYFAQHVELPKTKWAIAGRNSEKLYDLRLNLLKLDPACQDIGLIEADSKDEAALAKMAAQARVVLSTVGPYALYGEPLVKACIEERTHYLDITGEPNFVADMLNKYDAAAVENNTLIINCCGFDSIPADLGTFFTAQQFEQKQAITIKGFVKSKGQFSGGTWASALNAMSEGVRKKASSGKAVKKRKLNSKIHFDKAVNKWAVPMPVIDPWIVRRSAEAFPDIYSADFEYNQYIGLKNVMMLGGLLAGVGLVYAGAQFRPTRTLLMKLRESGEGPSAEDRANHFFKLTFYAESENQKVKTSVSGGDPGYSETSKMISESALAVLNHYDELPLKGGVVTPAGALGNFLLHRLQNAGIKFEVETV